MIKITIRFEYQEHHKVRGNTTFSTKEYFFTNRDEVEGFYVGLNAYDSMVYETHKVVSEEIVKGT